MTTDPGARLPGMAIWSRQRDGIIDLTGLVHHNDAGSQYTSSAFTDRLVEAVSMPSVGSVGDAYDNAPRRIADRHIHIRTDPTHTALARP